MIPSSFEYAAPETISDALKLLADNPESKLLAGGQSLIPLLKLRLAAPAQLIDLGAVPDLHFIAEEGNTIRIGAMTTHHQVETSDLLKQKCPLLPVTAKHIGDVQVRNRGTIGGSIAHADPAADYPAALLALEAQVKLVSSKGERVISLEEFYVDAMTTALEPGELLSEVHVPVEPSGARVAYRTMTQPASGFAIVGAGVRLHASNGKISTARVAVTGVASKPYRARAVESALEGQTAGSETFAAAAKAAAEGQEGLSDLYAGADYRAHLAGVLVKRALEQAAGG